MAERRDSKNRVLLKGEYQKADGRYMYKYVDSKGEQRFVYSWTLTQADRTPQGKKQSKCLRELEKEIAKDIHEEIDTFKAKKVTLSAFFDEYLKQKQELKPTTRTGYRIMYNNNVRNYIGGKALSDIKYSDIKKLYNHLYYEDGLSPSSISRVHSILHPVFEVAIRDGYIRSNPTQGVLREMKRGLNWSGTKRRALSIPEQKAFVDFVKTHEKYRQWMPLFTFFLGTGCRISEVLGLTWDDCDFKTGIISINHGLLYKTDEDTGKCRFYISTPKTDAGNREIPMMNAVREALLNARTQQERTGFSQSVIDGYSGFVFCNSDRGVILPVNVARTIDRIVHDHNAEEKVIAEEQHREPLLLPHFSPHNLRHTFCTRLCENETNIKVVQEIMGHSSIAVTMDIYNEATRDKKRESFASLEGKVRIC